jgi:Werner syndrome ATP-dependent helicase
LNTHCEISKFSPKSKEGFFLFLYLISHSGQIFSSNAMDSNNKSSDKVISEMVEMDFEHSKILEAIKVVGLSIPSIVEHIFNTSSSSSNREPSTTHISKSLPSNGKAIKKQTFSSSIQVPKSRTINHYFQSTSKVNEKNKNVVAVDVDDDVEEHMESLPQMRFDLDLDIVSDWEQRASILLQKHFGFSSLKSFQKEALSAWIARRDCLVLAATGSGFVLYLYLQKCY